MIADLKPYPKYKYSSVSWLGEVPEHWATKRLKWSAMLNPSKREVHTSLTGDTLVTFLPMERVGTDGSIDAREVIPASKVWNGFTYFRREDVLVAKITPCFENGKGASLVSLPTEVGFGSTEFHVIRAKSSMLPKYLYRMTTLEEFRSSGADAMTGAAGQQRVPLHFIANFSIAAPPLPEQAAIVRFLDHYDRKIRRYIRAKQKLIKLLEEQKQAIIHRAVTRGFDPNVRLKPSGVECLGNVPHHWDVRPAKYFYREVDERTMTGGEELLSVSHITGVTPRNQKNVTMFMASSYIGHKLCRPGDLVINTMWAWMAALGVARQTGIVSPSYAVYRPFRSTGLLGEYADLLLRTNPYVGEYVCRSTGIRSSRLRLYPEQFLRIRIVCPPVNEQKAILARLASEIRDRQEAIAGAQREISLLLEYRTRLISDVVTGKLDVREVAARLPDEADDAVPLNELDTFVDGDEDATDDPGDTPEEAEV